MQGVPIELPDVAVPTVPHTAALAAEQGPTAAAAALLQAYPPRGGIRMLLSQHTDGRRPLVERLVTEEYILDVLVTYDGAR